MCTAPKRIPIPTIQSAIIRARATELRTLPSIISKYESGATSISSIDRIHLAKYIELEACVKAEVRTFMIRIPGKTKTIYSTPPIFSIRVPTIVPKTNIKSVAEISGLRIV